MTDHPLLDIPRAFRSGRPMGITSVCSAHPVVIEAALILAGNLGRYALIEATCNQVNQEGGYTGMTPSAFRRFVEGIAEKVGFDAAKIILGGDHLGPNPWKDLPADKAMEKAEKMISAFAQAGFTKLHLDTSMGCRGEPIALSDEQTAQRAARLAAIAETSADGPFRPVYVIGTEVPVPGGALEELDHLQITRPAAVSKTYEVHREAFGQVDQQNAFSRVVALVVQPGVEFGYSDVVHFDAAKARELSACLRTYPDLVFEAHSTDYQAESDLAALVRNGFSILKVGPWLTFAYREALYGLDAIADVLDGHAPMGRLMATMEAVMLESPDNWRKYYPGTAAEQWLQRHFSLSDRIRYYWPSKKAKSAVDTLMMRLEGKSIPAPLLSQFVPGCQFATTACDAATVVLEAVHRVLGYYERSVAN